MADASSIVTEIISAHPDLVAVLFGSSVDSTEQTVKLRDMSNEERQKVVRQVYRRRAVACHPDKCSDPRGPQAFNNLKRAQEILLDDQLAQIFLADRGSAHDRFAATCGFEDMLKHTGGNLHFGYFLFGVAYLSAEKLATLSYKMFCRSSYLKHINLPKKHKGTSGATPSSSSPLSWMHKEQSILRKIIINNSEYEKLLEKRRRKRQQNPYYEHNHGNHKNHAEGLLSAQDDELFGLFSILKRVVRWDRLVRLLGLLCVILALVIGSSLHLGSSGAGPSGKNGCNLVDLVNRGSKCFNYDEEDGSVLRKESGLRSVKLTISKKTKIVEEEQNVQQAESTSHEDNTYFPSSLFAGNNESSNISFMEWKNLIREQSDARQRKQDSFNKNPVDENAKKSEIETAIVCRLAIDGDDEGCSALVTKLAYHHYLAKEQVKESWNLRRQYYLQTKGKEMKM